MLGLWNWRKQAKDWCLSMGERGILRIRGSTQGIWSLGVSSLGGRSLVLFLRLSWYSWQSLRNFLQRFLASTILTKFCLRQEWNCSLIQSSLPWYPSLLLLLVTSMMWLMKCLSSDVSPSHPPSSMSNCCMEQSSRLRSNCVDSFFDSFTRRLVVPIRKCLPLGSQKPSKRWNSWMWNERIRGFFLLKSLKGSPYSLRLSQYLLMGLLDIPKVTIPGKRVSRERINELLEEGE